MHATRRRTTDAARARAAPARANSRIFVRRLPASRDRCRGRQNVSGYAASLPICRVRRISPKERGGVTTLPSRWQCMTEACNCLGVTVVFSSLYLAGRAWARSTCACAGEERATRLAGVFISLFMFEHSLRSRFLCALLADDLFLWRHAACHIITSPRHSLSCQGLLMLSVR